MTSQGPRLEVTIAGETVEVDPTRPEGLTFGRGAELDIDSNPFLHRRVGRFVRAEGIWWIENLNPWTPITVVAGGSSTVLTGDARSALVLASTLVRFEAGVCNYELRAALDEVPLLPPTPELDIDLTATFRPSSLALTDEQRLLVVALAEARLRNPAERFRLPSNQSVAARLGWSTAKFNRKLDYLCQRLDRAGVSGLRATGRRANDRRLRVVDHLIADGTVTERDLSLLDTYDACREKGDGDGRR
ncbi:MAG: hypothetical protein M3Y51_01705 [Actinomycetota bacterium]|nr:hypothetical protein [Actinomycetota bacterium]